MVQFIFTYIKAWKSTIHVGEYTWILWVINGITILGGGFVHIFYSHPYLGKMSNLTNIFQMGWNHEVEKFPLVTGIVSI